MVQHEPHELVLPLRPGGGAVERPDQLQLLQALEGLTSGDDGRTDAVTVFFFFYWLFLLEKSLRTYLHDDRLLKVVHGARLPLEELLELYKKTRTISSLKLFIF